MKLTRTLIAVIITLAVLLPLHTQPASAATITFGGTLDSSNPTLNVAIISTPNCTGAYSGFLAQYAVIPFTVDTDGVYTFTETGSPNTAMYLYAGSFNPAAAATCIAASNANPISFTYPLTAGTQYYIVIINDTFAQTPLTYSSTISGPGAIITTTPGCDSNINIPSTAVGATFVADAPVYWAPGQLTEPLVTLQAGKSVRAIGLDESGQYYQILFQCQFLWVPANTLGPNFDNVWNGAPLPTNVVS